MNFRKFFCKSLKRGWLYRLFDCKRYEPETPMPPEPPKPLEPPILPDPPTPPPPPPPPPPPKHKLDLRKVYVPDGQHKKLCPVLIPPFGINRKIEEKDAEKFADKFAEEGWGNFIRLFVAGNWEPFWQNTNSIWFPYEKEGGKWQLKKKNPKHFDCLFRRADYFADRFIMPEFTLLDNSSIHNKPAGFWRTHWMNGDNNLNGTHNEAYSQTHWYEYDHPPHERPGMKETGEYLMDLYGFILEEAKKRYGKFFLIEIGNEIDARNLYHQKLRQFINQTLRQGVMDLRIFTSLKHDHFYQASVQNYCIPVLHGIGTYDGQDLSYVRRKFLIEGYKEGQHFGLSQDGCIPFNTEKQAKEDVLKILKTDTMSYEGNLRPLFAWEGGKWVNLISKGRQNEIDWTFKTLRKGLCRAFGEAFEDYLS